MVDDSDNYETRDLIKQMRSVFTDKEIVLVHQLRGFKEAKSISLARNSGVARSTAEVIIFADDDVILDKEYVKEILKVYEEHPNALGVGGYITNSREYVSSLRGFLSNLICKVFFLFHREEDSCRVLRSGYITYPYSMKGLIGCEWLSGTNSSYKLEVLKDFQWEENLKEFSLFEDVDISYRIHKRHPYSLYMTPHAKVVHKASPFARRDARSLIYFEITYHTYFFHKNVKQTLLNKALFFWSRFGHFITKCLFAFTRKRVSEIIFLIGSQMYVLRHLDEIRNGNFPLIYAHYR